MKASEYEKFGVAGNNYTVYPAGAGGTVHDDYGGEVTFDTTLKEVIVHCVYDLETALNEKYSRNLEPVTELYMPKAVCSYASVGKLHKLWGSKRRTYVRDHFNGY